MKYKAIAAALVGIACVLPMAAEAAGGIPGGFNYGVSEGNQLAGPIGGAVGGIVGSVVGGVVGGVQGVLGVEPQPVSYVPAPAAPEMAPVARPRRHHYRHVIRHRHAHH